jgi:hypothetical protein
MLNWVSIGQSLTLREEIVRIGLDRYQHPPGVSL